MKSNISRRAARHALLTGTAYAAETATTDRSNINTAVHKEGQWRSSKLIGVNVYNDNNDKIGEIQELIVDKSGKVENVVLGVGGFSAWASTMCGADGKLRWVNEPVKTSSTAAPATSRQLAAQPPAREANEKWYPDHAVFMRPRISSSDAAVQIRLSQHEQTAQPATRAVLHRIAANWYRRCAMCAASFRGVAAAPRRRPQTRPSAPRAQRPARGWASVRPALPTRLQRARSEPPRRHRTGLALSAAVQLPGDGGNGVTAFSTMALSSSGDTRSRRVQARDCAGSARLILLRRADV